MRSHTNTDHPCQPPDSEQGPAAPLPGPSQGGRERRGNPTGPLPAELSLTPPSNYVNHHHTPCNKEATCRQAALPSFPGAINSARALLPPAKLPWWPPAPRAQEATAPRGRGCNTGLLSELPARPPQKNSQLGEGPAARTLRYSPLRRAGSAPQPGLRAAARSRAPLPRRTRAGGEAGPPILTRRPARAQRRALTEKQRGAGGSGFLRLEGAFSAAAGGHKRELSARLLP